MPEVEFKGEYVCSGCGALFPHSGLQHNLDIECIRVLRERVNGLINSNRDFRGQAERAVVRLETGLNDLRERIRDLERPFLWRLFR